MMQFKCFIVGELVDEEGQTQRHFYYPFHVDADWVHRSLNAWERLAYKWAYIMHKRWQKELGFILNPKTITEKTIESSPNPTSPAK